jgi:hypothetical protein
VSGREGTQVQAVAQPAQDEGDLGVHRPGPLRRAGSQPPTVPGDHPVTAFNTEADTSGLTQWDIAAPGEVEVGLWRDDLHPESPRTLPGHWPGPVATQIRSSNLVTKPHSFPRSYSRPGCVGAAPPGSISSAVPSPAKSAMAATSPISRLNSWAAILDYQSVACVPSFEEGLAFFEEGLECAGQADSGDMSDVELQINRRRCVTVERLIGAKKLGEGQTSGDCSRGSPRC